MSPYSAGQARGTGLLKQIMERMMTSQESVTLYYCPQTRASGTRVMLEELGAPYTLQVMDLQRGETRMPEFLAVNPLGKVPTIRHRGAVVTEQIAIALYLGDAFPAAGLAPAPQDPDRGPYLRWMVYYAACFEPAVLDRSSGHDPGPPSRSVYGDFDSMLATFEAALTPGPYLLGDRISLADLQWGTALQWTLQFGLVPERPALREYVTRVTDRESFRTVWADDLRMVEQQQAARG